MSSSTTYNYMRTLLAEDPTSKFDTSEYRNNINEAKNTNAQTNAEYQNWKNTANEKQNAYSDAINNATSYQDYWNQAKEDAGLNAAKEQYQNSLNAVNATQATMNTLPSRVNASSNVALTSAQKNALLSKQQSAYGNTLTNWTNQNSADASMYQNALNEAQTNTAGNVSYQQQQIENKLSDYQTALSQLNTLHDQVVNEREQIRNWYGDMYDNYYRDLEDQIEIWKNKITTQASIYGNELDAEATKYSADAGLRLQQYLAKQQAAENASSTINYPKQQSYIDTYGNYYDPATGKGGKVSPQITYQNGTRVKTYVAPQ